jgi:hypothetical protein
MKGGLPRRTHPRYQQHDCHSNAPEPVCAPIGVYNGEKQSQNEDASPENKHVRPEVTRHNPANESPKHRSDEALARNRECRT